MALTQDTLISRLQTQLGLTKQQSQQSVERLFEILKDTLAQGENLLISGFGKFSVRQKNAPAGEKSSDQGGFDVEGPKGVGVQTLWGAQRTDEYPVTGNS
jgi:integration host factor subunit alpha